MQENIFIVEAWKKSWRVFQEDLRQFASVHRTQAAALRHAFALREEKDCIKVLKADGSLEIEFS